MTRQRIIELLEIEHECMLRGAHDECDRNCAACDLVQDDKELNEMYTNIIALLKEQGHITYRDCSDALLMLWMDNIITDGQYNMIMAKLNSAYKEGTI